MRNQHDCTRNKSISSQPLPTETEGCECFLFSLHNDLVCKSGPSPTAILLKCVGSGTTSHALSCSLSIQKWTAKTHQILFSNDDLVSFQFLIFYRHDCTHHPSLDKWFRCEIFIQSAGISAAIKKAMVTYLTHNCLENPKMYVQNKKQALAINI